MTSIVSMLVWGVQENKDNMNITADQWKVLMGEINKLGPFKYKIGILFNSTL
jgi:hypothetical protein